MIWTSSDSFVSANSWIAQDYDLPSQKLITFRAMGWLTKILKGSSHKISEGQYHGKYDDEGIWEGPPTSLDALSDFAMEDIDRAIALSLAEEDEKGSFSPSKEDKERSPSPPEEDHKEAVSSPEEDHKGKKVIDNDSHLDDDEQLAKAIQESLNVSPPRYNYGSLFPPYPYLYPSGPGYRICAGCNAEIGHGRFLSCMGGVWHPECFRCHACSLPISDYEFSMSENRPFHKSCYKERHHPKCDVCKNFIPTNAAGLIEYRAHPFWLQKYCPSHEHDGTPRCCSCERMEEILLRLGL